MILASIPLLLAMSSAQAVATLLNSPSASGVKTYAAALDIVEREAAAGKPLQQFVIGVTTEDKSLSQRYLAASRDRIEAMARRTNNPVAWYLLAKEKNDLSMLKRAADGGNVQALNAMGAFAMERALNVRGMTTNALDEVLSSSFVYFNEAAARGDANGFINLGTCYLRGFGCKRDMRLAFDCFRAAAEAGHPEGMDNVSACYQFGHGVEKNTELSLYWGMRGRAARGDKAAEKWLRERK